MKASKSVQLAFLASSVLLVIFVAATVSTAPVEPEPPKAEPQVPELVAPPKAADVPASVKVEDKGPAPLVAGNNSLATATNASVVLNPDAVKVDTNPQNPSIVNETVAVPPPAAVQNMTIAGNQTEADKNKPVNQVPQPAVSGSEKNQTTVVAPVDLKNTTSTNATVLVKPEVDTAANKATDLAPPTDPKTPVQEKPEDKPVIPDAEITSKNNDKEPEDAEEPKPPLKDDSKEKNGDGEDYQIGLKQPEVLDQDDAEQNKPEQVEDKKEQKQNNVLPSDEDEKDPFADEESSGSFLTYFLVISTLLVGAYVAYHNRAKIMAVVVEGRKTAQTRRRFNVSRAYERLENVQDAMPNLN